MANRDEMQQKLCSELGAEYCIRIIDLEPVIYRDFGNGYNVEISGMCTTSCRKRATIFLWCGGRYIEKTVYNVSRSDIGDRVEELRVYSEELVKKSSGVAK